jgi:hypothetical protein
VSRIALYRWRQRRASAKNSRAPVAPLSFRRRQEQRVKSLLPEFLEVRETHALAKRRRACRSSGAGELRMQTRIGSIAIPYLIDVLFQLRDAGRLSLDDPLSKYFPTVEDLGGRELLEGIAVEVVE